MATNRTGETLLMILVIIARSLASDDLRADDSPTSQATISFTDITQQAGVAGPTERGRTGGHAAIFADIDGSTRPDLYITMIFDDAMPDLFYRNLDGTEFKEEGALRGIDDFDGGSHGACFADLNNNGHFDLFNGATWHLQEHPAINRIYRNEGRGYFSDATSTSGIPPNRTWPTRGVLAFDMDDDGYLDLFCVTDYLGSDDPPDDRNEVYRNEGNLRFTPIEAGDLTRARCGQGAIATDFDGDRHPDVMAANRTGDLCILRNDGRGKFTLVDPAELGIRHRAFDGITTADVNNNGHLDVLLASGNLGHLYLNHGDGEFTFAQTFSETHGYRYMGGFADLNHDGFVDLIFAGDNNVYLNDGHGHFMPGPSVPVQGIDDARAIAFADIDGDGDLDFAVACKRSRNHLVRNDLAGGGGWLKVALISQQGQAGAYGAMTSIYPSGQVGRSDTSLLGTRESRSNHGYLAQDDPVLHFGLGTHEAVDVVVRFRDGSRIVRRNVAAGQTILIDGREG